jgi:hypothetical protein
MQPNTIRASLALILGLSASANAALISANGNVTLVSTTTVIDGGTIAGASDVNNSPAANGQVYTNAPGGDGTDYFVEAVQPAEIIFDLDLGSTQNIDAIAFWNRNTTNNGNAVTSFNAVFSTDSTFGNADDSQSFAFNPANNGGGQQDFTLGSVVNNAQYVRITIDDNDYGNAAGGDRVGFTEFQFNVVPEPSSAALLGLGGLALILRRRK